MTRMGVTGSIGILKCPAICELDGEGEATLVEIIFQKTQDNALGKLVICHFVYKF